MLPYTFIRPALSCHDFTRTSHTIHREALFLPLHSRGASRCLLLSLVVFSMTPTTSSTSTVMAASGPSAVNQTSQVVLTFTHFAAPILLLALFLVTFVAHSIATASENDTVQPITSQTGPGGKPLPRNTSPAAKAKQKSKVLDFSPARKLLFTWLSIGLILTFVGNAGVVIVHALVKRKDNWWCGQSVVVCGQCSFHRQILMSLARYTSLPRYSSTRLS